MTTKTGRYLAATADQLSTNTTADRLPGAVSQKALFRRSGSIALDHDELVLTDWGDGGDLVLHRTDVRSVRREYTELYGRFLGGLLDRGKPLILNTTIAGEIYLLINRKELMETTENKDWAASITTWLADT